MRIQHELIYQESSPEVPLFFLIIEIISYWSHLLFDCIEYNITIWYFIDQSGASSHSDHRWIECIVLLLLNSLANNFISSIKAIPLFSRCYSDTFASLLRMFQIYLQQYLDWISFIECSMDVWYCFDWSYFSRFASEISQTELLSHFQMSLFHITAKLLSIL